jgi:hypothetical protein
MHYDLKVELCFGFGSIGSIITELRVVGHGAHSVERYAYYIRLRALFFYLASAV